MSQQVEAVHEILRNSVCGECGHGGSHLGSLKIHIVSLFAASQGALTQHVEAVHEIVALGAYESTVGGVFMLLQLCLVAL